MEMDMLERPRIINVERKPRKCPVCGNSVVDIIYGTGDMTEPEFLMAYRREGMVVTIFPAVLPFGHVRVDASDSAR